MRISEFYKLLQSIGANRDAWDEALYNKDMVNVGYTGMILAELLLGRGVHVSWEQCLITEDSLWLVGVTEQKGEID